MTAGNSKTASWKQLRKAVMKIEYDPAKRDRTLSERGLDFERADEVLTGPSFQREDKRRDYGEQRFITTGALDGRAVILVWTRRGDAVRVISLRIADDEEREIYWKRMGRSR